MDDVLSVVNLVLRDNEYYVSSREIAEKFNKRHKDVLRSIRNLQVPENFRLRNFAPGVESDRNGTDQPVVYMTRDGFSILAFGFMDDRKNFQFETSAMRWKLCFLEAFNKMEKFIVEKVPALERTIRDLEVKVKELERRPLYLEEAKKPHGNKGTVLVPVTVTTLFGQDVEYHRVPKNSDGFSDLSYKEGELKRLTQLVGGMAKKMDSLAREVAYLRRK